MNILFLNSAQDWGGNEKWTYLAAKSLAEDHSVYIAFRKNYFGNRFDFGVEKFKLPFLFESDPYTIFKIVSIIKERQIDLLIPTKRKDYVLAGIAAKICKVKSILRLGIVRDLGNHWYNNFVYNKLADGIIVNADRIKRVLLKSEFMENRKIRVIYNGLDLDNLNCAANDEKPTSNFSFTISSMGRISRRKRFDYLIKGFNQFISITGADGAQLQIIGEGVELNAFKKLASRLRIEEKVNFRGYLTNPYPYLASSDVFVLLSENEGISNALLEAMYLKNAIIATSAGGTAEFIQNGINGFLVDKIDIVKIAELLEVLYLSPEKRKELGEEAHQTVLKKFSLKEMKDNLEGFCKEVL